MQKNYKGYSIAEVLVVVFIVATIAGLVLVNYRAGERSSNLNLAANKLASDIRLAQSYAMSQTEYNGDRSEEGWGVYLNSGSGNNTTYIIYSEDESDNDHMFDDSAPEEETYHEIGLPNGIEIFEIYLGGISEGNLSIGFEPPNPTTYFNNDSLTNTIATTTLREISTGATKSVIVNLSGLIDVD